ncbi:MAG: ectoine/hydroxyectoine ABC transporter permease subunit EhuD [Clostridiales bacterium]|nr:ectoine/hydroxyectoine ABC transporter permease subunit EhuD [Clostridiales bacterium]
MSDVWSWPVAWDAAIKIGKALPVTLLATVDGFVLAVLLGLLWVVARRLGPAWLGHGVLAAAEFIRSTPLLVQLFFLYILFPRWPVFWVGVLGLGLHYSTYLAEVYRAGIDSVEAGQWEAAKALNFSPYITWTRIILPQALRPILPVLGNYLITMFKETPLLFAINVMEMMAVAKHFGAKTFRYLEPFTVVAFYFLLLSYPSSLLVRWAERRTAKAYEQ